MSPEARRVVIPIVVISIAVLVLIVYATSSRRGSSRPSHGPDSVAVVEDSGRDGQSRAEDDADAASSVDAMAEARDDQQPAVVDDESPTEPVEVEVAEIVSLSGLTAVPPVRHDADFVAATLGSLDPRDASLLLEFSPFGAGVTRITLSDVWQTAAAKRQAEAHYAARDAGETNPPPPPDESLRYVIKEQQHDLSVAIPVLAAHSLRLYNVDGGDQEGQLVKPWFWTETGPGTFTTTIVNEAGVEILRLTREFVLGEYGDLTLKQRIENLTSQRLGISWRQYGPSDLELERARYFDPRRFRFGYLWTGRHPGSRTVLSEDNKLVLERRSLIKQEADDLWPTERTIERGYTLSWFAVVSRYFAIALHPVLNDPQSDSKSLEDLIEQISFYRSYDNNRNEEALFVYTISPMRTIEPQSVLNFDMGVYAGPMDRDILSEVEPFKSLGMNQLILFQMSAMCAICTFQWLAHFLLWFLLFLHDYVLFDWGLAIIGLVIVVRTLLHPITKRSQINMMRFGKQMQAMKPEIDKIQKKYKDDPKKLQQEQIRLMREHGVNPFQMLGCLPMFLQFPIWIALYAMLYFAYDLRHQPAMFGVFQQFWGWTFLADLSSGDHFFGEFETPFSIGFWHLTGLNLLPILMGVVMFIHQKYMTPPPTPNMTDEQIQQQRIMRVMMVGLLPIFLYNAPAGLTLYILTSSIIGIIESRYVRAHVDKLDLEPKKQPVATPTKKKKKPRDPQARAYAEAMDRMKDKKKQKPGKSFKKKRK